MVTKKTLVIAVLATFCLTSMLFMIKPTRSQTGIGEYDPWVDLNDDGAIDIYDAITLSNHFNTVGTQINKTALLLELQDKIESLNASLLGLEANLETRIPALEASVGELESKVATLQTTIDTLESRIATLERPGYMNAPAYDSGWLAISQGLNYNVNSQSKHRPS